MKSSGIGGQAVIEGVMMKNKEKYAVAVRKPDGEITVKTDSYVSVLTKNIIAALPIIRGVVTFFESMGIGIKTLTFSSSFYEEDDKNKNKKSAGSSKTETSSKAASNNIKDKAKNAVKANDEESDTTLDTNEASSKEDISKADSKAKLKENLMMAGTIALSVVLAIAIFMLLPYFLSMALVKVIDSAVVLTLIEGAIRLVLFIGYVFVISLLKDIKRVFMYHGAEHKSINCIEHGLELTVENVRKQSKQHKRCGTSFLLIVMMLSVIFFMFIRVDAAWLRVVLRLVLIPVIAGISYEFIRFAGNHDTPLMNVLSRPGLFLQGLTTKEPDDSMIEVAIQSVEAVFDWKAYLEECENDKTNSKKHSGKSNSKNTKQSEKSRNDKNNSSNKSETKTKSTNKKSEELIDKIEKEISVSEESADKVKNNSQSEKSFEKADSKKQLKESVDKVENNKQSAIEKEAEVKKTSSKSIPKQNKKAKTNEPMAPYKKIEEESDDDDILNALDKFFVDSNEEKDELE